MSDGVEIAMIKNFPELKKQLQELSSVINSFKSESVQLRIVELIFQGKNQNYFEQPTPSSDPQPGRASNREKTLKRKGSVNKEKTTGTSKKKAAGSKKGPAAILEELIDDDFFRSKRTISSIIEHMSSHKARNFKANEISSPLTRFIRNNRLKRQKNSDGQYEYYQ